jgi:hypothetical protein
MHNPVQLLFELLLKLKRIDLNSFEDMIILGYPNIISTNSRVGDTRQQLYARPTS